MRAAATAPLRSAGRLRILGNEVIRLLQTAWAHRVTQATAVLTTAATYLAIQFFIGGGRILDRLLVATAPGLFAYVVAFVGSLRLVAGLLEERNSGTLEQTHLSPVPGSQLVLGRVAAAIIEGVAMATVVTVGLFLIRGLPIPTELHLLLPVSLTLLDIVGFVLLLGAASFTFPGIGAVVHVVQMAVLVVNGTLVPHDLFPRWLELVAEVVPTTLGVSASRAMLTDDQTLGGLWQAGELPWLVVHAVVTATLGWLLYAVQLRRAIRDGKLGPT